METIHIHYIVCDNQEEDYKEIMEVHLDDAWEDHHDGVTERPSRNIRETLRAFTNFIPNK
jgi:hypothetical protein